MSRMPPKEQYVPCKDGNCNVSADFNVEGSSTSRFKVDLETLSGDKSFMGKDALMERLKKEIEERRCPDALSKYTLGAIGEDNVMSMSLKTIAKEGEEAIHDLQSIPNVKDTPKIILILESPHKDEYKFKHCSKDSNCSYRDYIRPAPARGSTGVNIKRYLSEIFACEEFNGYKVALVNPIQYQCSLGENDKKLKDDIFCNLLKMSHYKSCFEKRLECVYNPQKDILINCCTKGNNRELVWDKIRFVLRDIGRGNIKFPLMQMSHPSSWYVNCRNRCVQIVNQNDNKMISQKRFFCERDYVDLWNLLTDKRNNTDIRQVCREESNERKM